MRNLTEAEVKLMSRDACLEYIGEHWGPAMKLEKAMPLDELHSHLILLEAEAQIRGV